MTSRERVLTTLQHKEPDRVPIDFGGMRSTGIMAIAYNRLKKHLGLKGGETRVYDPGQQLAEPEQEILDLFEVDVVDLNNSFGMRPQEWKDWILPDGSPGKMPVTSYPVWENGEWVLKDGGRTRAHMPDGCLYFENCNQILERVETTAAMRKIRWKTYFTDEELREFQEKAKFLCENTDYAIMGGFGGNVLECGQEVRGWDNFMVDLVSNRSFAEDLMDELVEMHLANLKGFLQAVGDYIQIIQMGDDMGTQEASQISLGMYRELVKPRHRKIYQYVKEHSRLYVFLHSCGSIYNLIPDLIDVGVDILNPVQTSAAEMDPVRLKKEFGRKLTFWGGGCDTQSVLPYATPEEIETHVKERIGILAPGGGFVFTQVHNVQSNVPPENTIAMFNAVKKYRNYPIA
ncbi:MAG: uroporphyrinogen decarboxylase family protein [Bacteroidota bacterium]